MTHYRLTTEKSGRRVRALFYTPARYSNTAKYAAGVLGVELLTEELNRAYPMIKCKMLDNGKKAYYLPFDPNYDKVRVDLHRGEHFAYTVKEAAVKGFSRAG